MKRIVVLDGYALNPGDLDWSPLQTLGMCEIYERTTPEELFTRIDGAQIILTNKTLLPNEELSRVDSIEYIGVMATGINVVDKTFVKERGITLTNVPMYSTPSVVQTVFAHILAWTHHVAAHAKSVQEGQWASCQDFSYWNHPLMELSGKRLGIIGFGAIGQAVAKAAQAFGMEILVNTHIQDQAMPEGITWKSLDDLLAESDVLSLHCPLLPSTKHIINAERLEKMKSTALLINTSRGGLIDEDALAHALHEGQIGGAGLDVLSEEPPPAEHPLYNAPHCNITPHIAWATKESRQRLLSTVIKNVEQYLQQTPQNVI